VTEVWFESSPVIERYDHVSDFNRPLIHPDLKLFKSSLVPSHIDAITVLSKVCLLATQQFPSPARLLSRAQRGCHYETEEKCCECRIAFHIHCALLLLFVAVAPFNSELAAMHSVRVPLIHGTSAAREIRPRGILPLQLVRPIY
jgi:hypothetical protein